MADGQEAPPLDSGRSDDLQFAAHPGVKRQPLTMSLGGKLNLWGAGDAGGADQNSGPLDVKKTPGRQSLSEKMQRLLNLKSATSGGLADAAPSPTGRSGFLSRSLDTTLVDEAALAGGGSGTGSGPETPKAGKGRAGRTPGKSIWGKLGSGMKTRKTSPATMAARSSFEGASAVELPVPSGGSSGTQGGGAGVGGGGGPGGSCGGDDDGASCSDDYESSPRRAPSAAGGGFCEETLDLRHAIAAGYVMDGGCATPPSLPSDALEAMPDYLLTPGVARILGSGGDGPDPSGPAGGPLATPELLGGNPGGAGAAPWQDADATVALLPAAQLARAGHPGAADATMVLFPQQAAAAAEPETPAPPPAAVAAAAEAPAAVVAAAVAPAPAVVESTPVAAPIAEAPAAQEEPLPAKPQRPPSAAAPEAPAAAAEVPSTAPPAAEAPAAPAPAESSVDDDMPPLVDVASVDPVVAEEPAVPTEPAVAPAVVAPAAAAEPVAAAEAVPVSAEEPAAVAEEVPPPAAVAEEVTARAVPTTEEPAAAEPAAEPVAAEEAAPASAPASPPAAADAPPPAEATLSPSNSLRLSEEPPSAGAVPPAARGVRESIPLFVLQPGALAGAAKVRASEADLLTAMAGSADADVDAFLSAGDADAGADPAAAAAPGGRRRSSVGGSGRLLAGPQRVSMGGGIAAGAAAFVSRLEPVTEAVPSAANSDGEPE